MKHIYIFSLLFLLSCSSTFKFDKWAVTYPPEIEPQMQLWKDYAPKGIKYKELTIVLVEGLTNNGKKVDGLSDKRSKTISLDPTSAYTEPAEQHW